MSDLLFRPTVWPGQQIPMPPVLRPARVDREGAWLLFEPSTNVLGVAPEDVYLREFHDTDPRDLDALASLCSLGIVREVRLAEPAADLPLLETTWQYEMDKASAAYGIPASVDIDAERRALHQQDQQHRFPIHAAEVAYRVERIWDCTRHLLAYGAGEPVAKVWRNCANDRDAWYRFSEIANSALQAFHVHVDIQQNIRPASLYSVAMLQMINDLAAGGSVRRCANEACRRPFLKQRGRAKYDDRHRLHGVKYCDASCAQAQYQREKRRRDKAART